MSVCCCRQHLGSFGIGGDLALQPMYTLSGGQKSRVAFAKVTFSKPHILLLDEPSNHLDLDAVNALIQVCFIKLCNKVFIRFCRSVSCKVSSDVPHSSWLPAMRVSVIKPTCTHYSCTRQNFDRQNSLGTGLMHLLVSELGVLIVIYS